MPVIVPIIPFLRRRRRRAAMQSPPAALTLVAAEYEEAIWVRLTFDRAIDIGSLDGGAVVVDDGPLSGTTWNGLGGTATLIGPATVQIELNAVGPSASTDAFLNASAATGIVAVDDGGTWVGVSNVILPFP